MSLDHHTLYVAVACNKDNQPELTALTAHLQKHFKVTDISYTYVDTDTMVAKLKLHPGMEVRLLVDLVCTEMNLRKKYVFGCCQTPRAVFARRVLFCICYQRYQMSSVEVGKFFNKSHATVLLSLRMFALSPTAIRYLQNCTLLQAYAYTIKIYKKEVPKWLFRRS